MHGPFYRFPNRVHFAVSEKGMAESFLCEELRVSIILRINQMFFFDETCANLLMLQKVDRNRKAVLFVLMVRISYHCSFFNYI